MAGRGAGRSGLAAGEEVTLSIAYWYIFEAFLADVVTVADTAGRTRFNMFRMIDSYPQEHLDLMLSKISGDLEVWVEDGPECLAESGRHPVHFVVHAQNGEASLETLGPTEDLPLGQGFLNVQTAYWLPDAAQPAGPPRFVYFTYWSE